MIGVKFNKAMTPHSAGDVALVPDSTGAALIRDGHAVQYYFPPNPHAVEAGSVCPPGQLAINDGNDTGEIHSRRNRQFYRSKGR